MLVSIQSPEGTKRVECKPNESVPSFIKKVSSAFNLASDVAFSLFRQRNRTDQIQLQTRKSISHCIKHGDTLYLVFQTPNTDSHVESMSTMTSNSVHEPQKNSQDNFQANSFEEDEVDAFLFKENGCIQRERDEKLCRHGAHGKCVHCVPIEPYNEDYLREQNIKHLSFHSYLRKLIGGADKGKFAALENISCKIKLGCKEHLPWPQGICTKCQPNALTLSRQTYRHVDNVMFENPSLVERFFNYWRCTGHQRIGFLYGRYEHHKVVPLGVKATIAAIYEPPQDGSEDFVRLLPDEHSELVEKIAHALGLVKVGWIFTDLAADDLQKGTVKHLRNISTYFMSAQECILAGHYQNAHPNGCRLSPDGYFGSKFVTVCVTGDADNHVHMEGYQVSNQCMALVRDSCLVPTVDAPELAYVKESTNEQYIPDVFYTAKDDYGNEITRLARPLPIEYLLVDVPVSTPVEPQFTFNTNTSVKPFPVENRMIDDHVQTLQSLADYLRQFSPDQFLEAASDFHLLLFIASQDMVPLKDVMDPLLEAVKTKNTELASQWVHGEHWEMFECFLDAQGFTESNSVRYPFATAGEPQQAGSATNSSSSTWTCKYCTFINPLESNLCEMCNLPK